MILHKNVQKALNLFRVLKYEIQVIQCENLLSKENGEIEGKVIAERLSEEEIGGLKQLFKMIDTDNSGTITYEELKDGLKRVGSDLAESDIKALMRAADFDNSGTIDFWPEFIAATLHLNKMEREENLLAAFSYFDKDGSGYITTDELQQACIEFGLGDVKLDDIIKEIDIDNDGRIDYGEFATMMKKGNTGFAARTMRGNLNFSIRCSWSKWTTKLTENVGPTDNQRSPSCKPRAWNQNGKKSLLLLWLDLGNILSFLGDISTPKGLKVQMSMTNNFSMMLKGIDFSQYCHFLLIVLLCFSTSLCNYFPWKLTLDIKVLLVGTKTSTWIGKPVVPNATVHAVVEEQLKDKKVVVFKYKKKKNYRRNIGHRQPITRIRILGITGYQDSPAVTLADLEAAK
ncbi:Calcium-dependent protein kinase 12 [Datura stramonium]|uniref:Calcium-dependent protein kinase 12 n=1 Tax=Datura stramonium TaxID=4076 RepID=A0ABS8T493_DATST|nr:Calcium-dependent protein kinase 12 [Datura stramonium]